MCYRTGFSAGDARRESVRVTLDQSGPGTEQGVVAGRVLSAVVPPCPSSHPPSWAPSAPLAALWAETLILLFTLNSGEGMLKIPCVVLWFHAPLVASASPAVSGRPEVPA